MQIGYDKEYWDGYGEKRPIEIDIARGKNSHMLICGMSGAGKSYAEIWLFSEIARKCPNGEFYFADFKQEDEFSFLRGTSNYYAYMNTLQALDVVYERMHMRQSGKDETRHSITLIFDEYCANMLALDKTKAQKAMAKVSEILMLGRSLGIRLIATMQRPDASVFPNGARLNYGIVIVLGASVKSIYEMLIPSDLLENMSELDFKTGEGLLLLNGSLLQQIKIPMLRDSDMEKLREVCVKALS